MAATYACKAAIKAGDNLSYSECAALIDKLFNTEAKGDEFVEACRLETLKEKVAHWEKKYKTLGELVANLQTV